VHGNHLVVLPPPGQVVHGWSSVDGAPPTQFSSVDASFAPGHRTHAPPGNDEMLVFLTTTIAVIGYSYERGWYGGRSVSIIDPAWQADLSFDLSPFAPTITILSRQLTPSRLIGTKLLSF